MSMQSIHVNAVRIFQVTSVWTLITITILLAVYTLLCLFGFMPWLYVPLQFGQEGAVVDRGTIIQLLLVLVMFSLCYNIPSSARIMRMEVIKHKEHLGLQDIMTATAHLFEEDRNGAFSVTTQFDNITRRIEMLQRHETLDKLSDKHQATAAMISYQVRKFAKKFSKKKVDRANTALQLIRQRLTETETIIADVTPIVNDLASEYNDIVDRERICRARVVAMLDQIQPLLEQFDLIPQSDDKEEEPSSHREVIALPKTSAKSQ